MRYFRDTNRELKRRLREALDEGGRSSDSDAAGAPPGHRRDAAGTPQGRRRDAAVTPPGRRQDAGGRDAAATLPHVAATSWRRPDDVRTTSGQRPDDVRTSSGRHPDVVRTTSDDVGRHRTSSGRLWMKVEGAQTATMKPRRSDVVATWCQRGADVVATWQPRNLFLRKKM